MRQNLEKLTLPIQSIQSSGIWTTAWSHILGWLQSTWKWVRAWGLSFHWERVWLRGQREHQKNDWGNLCSFLGFMAAQYHFSCHMEAEQDGAERALDGELGAAQPWLGTRKMPSSSWASPPHLWNETFCLSGSFSWFLSREGSSGVWNLRMHFPLRKRQVVLWHSGQWFMHLWQGEYGRVPRSDRVRLGTGQHFSRNGGDVLGGGKRKISSGGVSSFLNKAWKQEGV